LALRSNSARGRGHDRGRGAGLLVGGCMLGLRVVIRPGDALMEPVNPPPE
jgi:hypothetical protein